MSVLDDEYRPKFSKEHEILSRATEFAHFHGFLLFFLQNFVESNTGTNTTYFGRVRAAVDN